MSHSSSAGRLVGELLLDQGNRRAFLLFCAAVLLCFALLQRCAGCLTKDLLGQDMVVVVVVVFACLFVFHFSINY